MSDKILHLDLDAFYPSVEVLDQPQLAGLPVIVGGLGSRGVVASASYEARALGVHSALPMAVARRRCPDGVYLRPRFSRYRELSRQIFAIYEEWTPLVEPLSIDEAYLDVGHRREAAVEVAETIKRQVRDATGLTVSAGVAHNKFLAKLASDHDKPDGLTCIRESECRQFLAPLPVDKLWGVGPATAQRLRELGYRTIGDVAAARVEALQAAVGRQGPHLVTLANGIDARPVSPPGAPRSISAETTFEQDRRTWAEVAPHVRQFAARIDASLTRHGMWARTVVLKVRFQDFRTVTRSLTPDVPVRSSEEVLAVARQLARRVELGRGRRMRLVGLGVNNLIDRPQVGQPDPTPGSSLQLRLFAESDPSDA